LQNSYLQEIAGNTSEMKFGSRNSNISSATQSQLAKKQQKLHVKGQLYI